MKIPRPIGDLEYSRELARLVARFERDIANQKHERSLGSDTHWGRFYAALKKARRPMSAHEVSRRAGLKLGAVHNRVLAQKLEQFGWIERVGTALETRRNAS